MCITKDLYYKLLVLHDIQYQVMKSSQQKYQTQAPHTYTHTFAIMTSIKMQKLIWSVHTHPPRSAVMNACMQNGHTMSDLTTNVFVWAVKSPIKIKFDQRMTPNTGTPILLAAGNVSSQHAFLYYCTR